MCLLKNLITTYTTRLVSVIEYDVVFLIVCGKVVCATQQIVVLAVLKIGRSIDYIIVALIAKVDLAETGKYAFRIVNIPVYYGLGYCFFQKFSVHIWSLISVVNILSKEGKFSPLGIVLCFENDCRYISYLQDVVLGQSLIELIFLGLIDTAISRTDCFIQIAMDTDDIHIVFVNVIVCKKG